MTILLYGDSMHINKLSGKVIDICYHVHVNLGPGLFESIYEQVLSHEFQKHGLHFQDQQPIPVYWDNQRMGVGYRADIIVDNRIIIEIKSVEHLAPVHYKQLLTYLKLTDIKLGLLINFNEAYFKKGVKRVVNGL